MSSAPAPLRSPCPEASNLCSKWEDNLDQHLDIISKIQNFRENVLLCEFVDSNSFNYLPKEDRPNKKAVQIPQHVAKYT